MVTPIQTTFVDLFFVKTLNSHLVSSMEHHNGFSQLPYYLWNDHFIGAINFVSWSIFMLIFIFRICKKEKLN